MRIQHPIVQAVVLVIASMAIAVIANGFAGRTRRLVLPGWYPNAMTAPTRAPQTASTATTEQSPAPGNPPIVIPSTTITNTAAPSDTAAQPQSSTAVATTTTPTGQPGQPANPTTQPIQPTQQPSNPATQQPNVSKFTPHPDKAYVEISGDDAVALHRAGSLFLDARRTSIYEEGHIPGSRSFSVWEADIDDKVTALFEERQDPAEQNKPIVIYCSGGACEDSHMLAQKLWGIQFNNVYVYKDGYPDWQQRGLPTKTGAQP